jgi:hypothetical protein
LKFEISKQRIGIFKYLVETDNYSFKLLIGNTGLNFYATQTFSKSCI